MVSKFVAGANKEALALAHAAGLDFIRVENYIYGHIADEGYLESCAGELLRYKRAIGAMYSYSQISRKSILHMQSHRMLI